MRVALRLANAKGSTVVQGVLQPGCGLLGVSPSRGVVPDEPQLTVKSLTPLPVYAPEPPQMVGGGELGAA